MDNDCIDKSCDNLAGIEDVIAAYRVILGRNPDRVGIAHYQNLIKGGLSLDKLLANFLQSPEFKAKIEDDKQRLTVDCGGYQVCVVKGEKDFGDWIAISHTWEPHIVKTISTILKKGDTFVDVGANVGVMTFCAAKLVGETGKVIAFEPNPDNLQLLYCGILKNNFKNVLIMPFAASDRVAVFSLAGGASNSHLTTPQEGGYHAQSIVMDDYLLEMVRLDLVKMDIEGHEPFALAGLHRSLRKHKPLVLLEFNPRCLRDVSGIKPEDFLDMVFDTFDDIDLIENSGQRIRFEMPADLSDCWKLRNQQSISEGLLPDGMLHFDILAKTKPCSTPIKSITGNRSS